MTRSDSQSPAMLAACAITRRVSGETSKFATAIRQTGRTLRVTLTHADV